MSPSALFPWEKAKATEARTTTCCSTTKPRALPWSWIQREHAAHFTTISRRCRAFHPRQSPRPPARASVAAPLPRPTRRAAVHARRLTRDGAACVPSGMWIFTRQQARDEGLVAKTRGIAVAKGLDVSVLKYVNQTACVNQNQNLSAA
eukprot:scaffold18729_cov66-Phaeocystis_antarctica.AAC.2